MGWTCLLEQINISAGEADRYAYIHGCDKKCYYKVIRIIRKAVQSKERENLDTTIVLQMVLIPEFKDQILSRTKLGKELEGDYLVIKHCSDDEESILGIDYEKYYGMVDLLKEAESMS